MGFQNQAKITKNLASDPHVSFLLPWSPKVSPSCQNGPQGPKVEAPGLPNDRFWTPKKAMSMSEVTAVSKNAMKTDLQKQTCLRTYEWKTQKTQNAQ